MFFLECLVHFFYRIIEKQFWSVFYQNSSHLKWHERYLGGLEGIQVGLGGGASGMTRKTSGVEEAFGMA